MTPGLDALDAAAKSGGTIELSDLLSAIRESYAVHGEALQEIGRSFVLLGDVLHLLEQGVSSDSTD